MQTEIRTRIVVYPKTLLDSPKYKVRPEGFWRSIWPLVTRDLQSSNFFVVDKRRRKTFRLTIAEQEVLMGLSQHLLAFWKAPDFHNIGKTGRLVHSEAILEDAVEAIVDSRNGDEQRLKKLGTFNHRDFVEHVWKICGL